MSYHGNICVTLIQYCRSRHLSWGIIPVWLTEDVHTTTYMVRRTRRLLLKTQAVFRFGLDSLVNANSRQYKHNGIPEVKVLQKRVKKYINHTFRFIAYRSLVSTILIKDLLLAFSHNDECFLLVFVFMGNTFRAFTNKGLICHQHPGKSSPLSLYLHEAYLSHKKVFLKGKCITTYCVK